MDRYDEVDMYSGLAAMHWSAYDDPSWDHDFYKQVVEQAGGLALDVACGAGRLMRRYLKDGLAVEGVDSSADMLAVCRQRAEAEGLSPVLYCQPMQELDLPKRYDCIYVPCGSWTCVVGRDNAQEALRRFYEHLRPGGVLAFNVYWGDWGDYDYSNPEKERVYPGEWKPHVVKELGGERRLVVDRRTTGVDPVEQLSCEERRYRLMDGETLLGEEVHAGQNHWYFKAEVVTMLQLAGFADIEVTGDYTGIPFGAEHTDAIVFVCRKAGGVSRASG